jgi:hypothetical protein
MRASPSPRQQAGSAFVPVQAAQWRDVLAVQEERTVAPDNTVAWKGQRLKIPAHPALAHFVRAEVRVHEHFDGELAIFHGPRCLVRWRSDRDEGEDAAADPEILQPPREPLAPQPEACGKPGRAVPARPPFPQAQHHQAVNSCAT